MPSVYFIIIHEDGLLDPFVSVSPCSASVQWPGLINAMSGLLCAHLNFIGPTSTYEPTLSFRPQGPIIGKTHTPVLHVYATYSSFSQMYT